MATTVPAPSPEATARPAGDSKIVAAWAWDLLVPSGLGRLVELSDDGDTVPIEAFADALLLFGHADPIGEPVVAHGPFVMNTRQEILDAIRDYQSGKFAGGTRLE